MGAKHNLSSSVQADHLLNAGIALQRDGNLLAAKSLYEQLLGIDDKNIPALQLLALVYSSTGESGNSLKLIDHALKVDAFNAASHHSKGFVMMALGRVSEALNSYDRAVALKTDDATFFKDRGIARCECGLVTEAISDFEQALELTPTDSSLLNYVGTCFNNLGAHDKAIQAFKKAAEIDPLSAEAHYDRSEALKNLSRIDDALASVDKALEICPGLDAALLSRGDLLMLLDKPRDALIAYDDAIRHDQTFARAHNNRGFALYKLGALERALQSYERAVELEPDYPEAHWNRALLYLLSGDYKRGWPLYEWRLKANKDLYTSYTKPSWRGEYDISDKRLFICAEQGLGDLIQFSRYAPLLNDMALEVILEVPRVLLTTLASMCPEVTLCVKNEESPEFDVVCPLMSLPHVFNTTLETIPSPEKYLSTEPAKVSIWRERLGPKQKLRIGVVWSGAANHKDDINRSIYLGALVSIMDDSFEWHSLQKEYRPDDWDILNQSPQICQHQEDLQDFADTAALIECMDLVITVDTSVAHLAGALGTPVWIMLSKSPDFRWLLGRQDSPWYASARLFRQENRGDWESVLSTVASSLPLAKIKK